MVAPSTSIFISHSNVAPGAEPVFDALIDEKQGLRSKLGDNYAGYELFWDRQIEAAADWRASICQKLCICAAAVILLSKEAFEAERWWVRFETFFLTTLKSGSRQDLCIVPVYLGDVEPLLKTSKAFDANDLRRYQAIRFPGDAGLKQADDVVAAIAKVLKNALPKGRVSRLSGLVKVLSGALKKLPHAALAAAADRLDPDRGEAWSQDQQAFADQLAERFAGADEATLLQAFGDLCDEARDRGYRNAKHHVASTLATLRLKEEHAMPMAIEAALPAEAGCRHALLLSHADPSMVDLYIARAAGKDPHPWTVLPVNPVLEHGHSEDLKTNVSRIVAAKLGLRAGADFEKQLKLAKDTIPKMRKAGRPALVMMDYASRSDPVQTLRTVRDVDAELLLLLSASPEAPDLAPDVSILRLSGVEDHNDLSGTLNTMRLIADQTTPGEENSG